MTIRAANEGETCVRVIDLSLLCARLSHPPVFSYHTALKGAAGVMRHLGRRCSLVVPSGPMYDVLHNMRSVLQCICREH
ncbi:hypothetical protein RRG08_027047 [Elysia crispata]|uniref:Uncharacterized protein n=1 Tax=Elysia crispata TaxID=231223 RepID=A0AAE0ZHL1_9GAST|nr:hypothetical protein RRG08_027047 [Elysia crispata]